MTGCEAAADQRPQPGLHRRVQHHDGRRQAELVDLVAEEREARGRGEHLGSAYGVPDVLEPGQRPESRCAMVPFAVVHGLVVAEPGVAGVGIGQERGVQWVERGHPEPPCQSVESVGDLRRAAGEGEPHELVAPAGVEVDAGRGGHARVVEQAQAPGVGVVGEVADVGVRVEGAVRRRQLVDPQPAAGRRGAALGWSRTSRRDRRARRRTPA